jgi:hypothetical protein
MPLEVPAFHVTNEMDEVRPIRGEGVGAGGALHAKEVQEFIQVFGVRVVVRGLGFHP